MRSEDSVVLNWLALLRTEDKGQRTKDKGQRTKDKGQRMYWDKKKCRNVEM